MTRSLGLRWLAPLTVLLFSAFLSHASFAQDSDFDGVLDADEALGDTDGDGTIDKFDIDDDGDGILTKNELGAGPGGSNDADGDGIPNHLDTDDDNDGIPTAFEGNTSNDTDRDFVSDPYDDDDDNDGFKTADEGADPSLDLNMNGQPDHLDDDAPGLAVLPQAYLDTDSTSSGRIANPANPFFTAGESRFDSDTSSDIDGTLNALTHNLSTDPFTFSSFGTGEVLDIATTHDTDVQFSSSDEFLFSSDYNFSGSTDPLDGVFNEIVVGNAEFIFAFTLEEATAFDIAMSLLSSFDETEQVPTQFTPGDSVSRLQLTLDGAPVLLLENEAGQPDTAGLVGHILDAGLHTLKVNFRVTELLTDDPNFDGDFEAFVSSEVSLSRSTTTVVPIPAALPLFVTALIGLGLVRLKKSKPG